VDTLASIQNQGECLKHISAVYLADDCSTDNTVQAAKENWNSSIPFEVIQRSENFGERDNVNRFMSFIGVSTDWVLMLHADDISKPHWLKTMIRYIESSSQYIGVICSSWDNIYPDGTVVPGEDNPNRPVELIIGDRNSVIGTLKQGCWLHISGCAIRTTAFRDIGNFDPELPQNGDWEWLMRLLNKGWTVAYIPRTLIKYRSHIKSVSTTSFNVDRDIKESLLIINKYSNIISKKTLFEFHFHRAVYTIRRMGRALIEGRFSRILLSFRTLILVFRNLITIIMK